MNGRQAAAIALALSAGCATGDGGTTRETMPAMPTAEVAAQLRAAGDPDGEGRRILALDAALCLRCKNVGLLIRRLRSDSAHALTVVAPAGDVIAVRDYLRREKVSEVQVLPAHASLFAHPIFSDSVLVTWGEPGRAPQHLVAADGEILLQALRTSADRAGPERADQPFEGGKQ